MRIDQTTTSFLDEIEGNETQILGKMINFSKYG